MNHLKELIKRHKADKVGKQTCDSFYIHKEALDIDGQVITDILRALFDVDRVSYNVVKISNNGLKISFLLYESFFTEKNPALLVAYTCCLKDVEVLNFKPKVTDYRKRKNPFILHRKELLYPNSSMTPVWKERTLEEEKLGFYKNTAIIGTRNGWAKVKGETV